MNAPQIYSFTIDAEAHKLVTVHRRGRTIEVKVRLAADVVLDSSTIEIRDAIDHSFKQTSAGLSLGGSRR